MAEDRIVVFKVEVRVDRELTQEQVDALIHEELQVSRGRSHVISAVMTEWDAD